MMRYKVNMICHAETIIRKNLKDCLVSPETESLSLIFVLNIYLLRDIYLSTIIWVITTMHGAWNWRLIIEELKTKHKS